MGKPWMPKTAGILAIIGGSLNILGTITFYTAFVFFTRFLPSMAIRGFDMPAGILSTVMSVATVLAVFRALVDILAIVGGVFCLRKRSWGTGLAGSIAAVFAGWLLGIPALVLVIMGKDQFK
jgi:hypothetical protein